MEDSEIYNLATEVIRSIASDLSDGIYKNLGGSLSVAWNAEQRVTAWAESSGDPESVPQHRVIISYELARRFYRDAEDYHEFASSGILENQLGYVYQDFNPKPRLPDHIDRKDSINNMFVAALTWVFFHEIGHLVQEHGHIRSTFSDLSVSLIEDCESDGQQLLEGRAASISHVTEFAADVEATSWCIQELARHFLEEGNTDRQILKDFQDNLFLMVCGISCAFYRFNGERDATPESYPIGSHPTPIRRLEVCIPNIFEKLDSGGHGEKIHGMSRSELVHLCIGAANSSGFFWLWRYSEGPEIPDDFMTKGILQDKYVSTYWREIILIWEEIEPAIIKIRRFGSKFGILTFTDELRSHIFASSK